MPLIVETGAGTPGANSYVTTQFITNYLTDRNRLTENGWSTAGAAQAAAAIAGTQYIETRFRQAFRGSPLLEWITGRKSSGTLTLSALPLNTETFQLGIITYRFVAALEAENDILIGADEAATLQNLADAIENGGDGTTSHELTRINYEASGLVAAGTSIVCAARVEGESGDEILFTSTITAATLTGSGKLEGGIDSGPQPLSFPKKDLRGRNGQLIVGIPLRLKMSTAEYAVRALASKLDPDPVVDDAGVAIKAKSESFGPFKEATTYVDGAPLTINRPYPAADRLLAEFLRPLNRVIR